MLAFDTLVKDFLGNGHILFHVKVERRDMRGKVKTRKWPFDIRGEELKIVYDALESSPFYKT